MLDFDILAAGPITASLVVSANGEAVSSLGNSKTLGNQSDLQLLKWFRARSEIVLTSGLTAELEGYRYPTKTKLAILSKSPRTYASLGQDLGRVLFLSDSPGFAEAVAQLSAEGYKKIHTEFGPTGFKSLVESSTVDGYVSSTSPEGISKFLEDRELLADQLRALSADLFVAKAVGRGKA